MFAPSQSYGLAVLSCVAHLRTPASGPEVITDNTTVVWPMAVSTLRLHGAVGGSDYSWAVATNAMILLELTLRTTNITPLSTGPDNVSHDFSFEVGLCGAAGAVSAALWAHLATFNPLYVRQCATCLTTTFFRCSEYFRKVVLAVNALHIEEPDDDLVVTAARRCA